MTNLVTICRLLLILIAFNFSYSLPVLNHQGDDLSGPSHSGRNRHVAHYGASRLIDLERIQDPDWDNYSFHPIKDSPLAAQDKRKELAKMLKSGTISKSFHKIEIHKTHLKENAIHFIQQGGVVQDGENDVLIHLGEISHNDLNAHLEAGHFRIYRTNMGLDQSDELTTPSSEHKFRKNIRKEQKTLIEERRYRSRLLNKGKVIGTGSWLDPDLFEVPVQDRHNLVSPPSSPEQLEFDNLRRPESLAFPVSNSPITTHRQSRPDLRSHSIDSSPPSPATSESPPLYSHLDQFELETDLRQLSLKGKEKKASKRESIAAAKKTWFQKAKAQLKH